MTKIKIMGEAGCDFNRKFKMTEIPKKTYYELNEKRTYSSPISLTTQFYFCPVPLRLDTYSGCSHNCLYCFANNSNQKYINDLNFKTNYHNISIIPTKLNYIKKYFDIAFEGATNTFNNQEALAVECIKHRVPIHFGGMSDPLQPIEKNLKITYETLKLLKKYNYPVIFSTKGKLLLDESYYKIINNYENFALQISLIDDRPEVIETLDPNAMTVEERFKAFEKYSHKWTACRIQPFIVGLSESRIIPMLDKLKNVNVNHIMVEGLKFFSGNKQANKRIGEAFKKITGKSFDLLAYYKAIGAKHSGNDIELPSWRKYKYIKIFKKEIKKRGMTYGAADNDLRYLGDSPCCCGVEGLKGFNNLLKHNTGYAIFRALKNNLKVFDKSIIEKEWMPDGTFRQVISLKKLKKKLGKTATYKDANIPLKKLFNDSWKQGKKNSPCDVCIIKYLGHNKYKILNDQQQKAILKDRGEQKRLF